MKPVLAISIGFVIGAIFVWVIISSYHYHCPDCDSCCPTPTCFPSKPSTVDETAGKVLINNYNTATAKDTIRAMNIPISLFEAMGYEWQEATSSGIDLAGFRVYYGKNTSSNFGIVVKLDPALAEMTSSYYPRVAMPSDLAGPCPDMCDSFTSGPDFD